MRVRTMRARAHSLWGIRLALHMNGGFRSPAASSSAAGPWYPKPYRCPHREFNLSLIESGGDGGCSWSPAAGREVYPERSYLILNLSLNLAISAGNLYTSLYPPTLIMVTALHLITGPAAANRCIHSSS